MRRLIIVGAAALALSLTACEGQRERSAQSKGQAQTEAAFEQQSTAVPYPVTELRDSLERRNLRERLLRLNRPEQISYVYLLGDTGTYIGYYAIKGKVSSIQSQMTTDNLIVESCPGSGDGRCPVVVSAPGDDGSYGANENGIFFFTTEGVMVTTDMRYILSDAPLRVEAPKMNVPKA